MSEEEEVPPTSQHLSRWMLEEDLMPQFSQGKKTLENYL
jgi:hypothetical protein